MPRPPLLETGARLHQFLGGRSALRFQDLGVVTDQTVPHRLVQLAAVHVLGDLDQARITGVLVLEDDAVDLCPSEPAHGLQSMPSGYQATLAALPEDRDRFDQAVDPDALHELRDEFLSNGRTVFRDNDHRRVARLGGHGSALRLAIEQPVDLVLAPSTAAAKSRHSRRQDAGGLHLRRVTFVMPKVISI
ncbi:hypothetical protein WBG79_03680 [Prosthecomicrobium sp. N25]